MLLLGITLLAYAGCTQRTLLAIDPYIAYLFPTTFSERAIRVAQAKYRRPIDIFTIEQNTVLSDDLSLLLSDGTYDAVIATPLHAPYVAGIAEAHPDIRFWQLGGPIAADAALPAAADIPTNAALPTPTDAATPANRHTLVFDSGRAMEEMAEYLATEYPEFDNEFLFLVNPRTTADRVAIDRLQEALTEQKLKFDLQRFESVGADDVESYIEQINAGRYIVTGVFLKGYNPVIYSRIELEQTAIITEHIGDARRYRASPAIVASIEYDYRRGLSEILAAIRADNDEAPDHITLDADFILYK